MANTRGFASIGELHRHFQEHGGEFGIKDAVEYEKTADALWFDPKPAHVEECRRNKGDLIRFDTQAQSYGVLDRNGAMRTFFKPVPCSSLPMPQRKAMMKRGRCHREPTNLLYFERECKRW